MVKTRGNKLLPEAQNQRGLVDPSGLSLVDPSGFSLVEMMIVVAIIGIMTSIALPNYRRYQERSRDAEAKVLLTSIYSTEQVVRSEFGGFTSMLGQFGYRPEGFNPTTGIYSGYFTHGFKKTGVCQGDFSRVASRKVAALPDECGGSQTTAGNGNGATNANANGVANSNPNSSINQASTANNTATQ